MSTVVRVAGSGDGPALAALRAAWTREVAPTGTSADETFPDRFGAWLDDELPHRTFWLAEVDGDAVGMANVLTFERMPRPGVGGSRWAYLGNMFVLAEHRRTGIGRLLARTAIDDAVAAGCVRVVLNPSELSLPFWHGLGFAPATELLAYHPDGA